MNGLELAEQSKSIQQQREARAARPIFDVGPAPEPSMRDKHDEEIAGRVTAYKERVKEIESDTALSDTGKAQLLQRLYEETSGQVAAMRGAAQETVESRTNALTRQVFGIGQSTASDYREAQDRVSKMSKPGDLATAMDQAEAIGDTTLLRAGFAHAWQRSRGPMASDAWANIVSEYVRLNPGVADSLNELERLTSTKGRTAESIRTMRMSVTKPKGIR